MSHLERTLALLMESQRLGFKALSDGTRLIGRVPHVAPEAWLHIVFRRLTEAEVVSLEDDLGRRLHAVYREFLLEANGLSLFSDAISMFGLRTSYARGSAVVPQPYSIVTPNREERPRDAPRDVLFIGCYRWDGSLLYIASDSSIHRCNRESAASIHQWGSLDMFLFKEAVRMSRLCDGEGRIDSRTPTIP